MSENFDSPLEVEFCGSIGYTELDDAINAMIDEVAPPPLVVSETAVRQMMPLLRELVERRNMASATELPPLSLSAKEHLKEGLVDQAYRERESQLKEAIKPVAQGGDYRPHYRKRETDAFIESLQCQLLQAIAAREAAEQQLKIVLDRESETTARYDIRVSNLSDLLDDACDAGDETAACVDRLKLRVAELEAQQSTAFAIGAEEVGQELKLTAALRGLRKTHPVCRITEGYDYRCDYCIAADEAFAPPTQPGESK